MRNYPTNRDQMIGMAVAIIDYMKGEEQRKGIDWNQYDHVPASQLIAPIEIVAQENERVKNLLRNMRRREGYEDNLNAIHPVNAFRTEAHYVAFCEQIRLNHILPERRAGFGLSAEDFGYLIRCKPGALYRYENFKEFMTDKSMLYAFEQTADIPVDVPKRFGRKFQEARKRYQKGDY